MFSPYSAPPAPVRDYISSSSQFESDSISLRQDYERAFLDHKRAVSHAKRTMTTFNEEVYGANGLKARLAANHRVNPPRENRAMIIARDNSKLVERLTEISFKSHSATTNQIVERNKRARSRLSPGGSLNDHIRALERDRIDEANMGLAARLLANKSEYAPENFRQHQQQHEYLLRNKSRLRAIQMKTSTPGAQPLPGRARSSSPHRRSGGDGIRRTNEAELQASDEYAGALRSYTSQQRSLGYGLTTALPPIPKSTDNDLGGHQDAWLEQHQSDLQRIKQVHTHAPKVRQSLLSMNPREALHAPLSNHYHHKDLKRSSDMMLQAQQLQAAFQSLDQESRLIIPRTRLDPNTGAYETVWVDFREARPEETHLAQRCTENELAMMKRQEHERPFETPHHTQPHTQQSHAQRRAIDPEEYQQQSMEIYEAYLAQMHQLQQQSLAHDESKESSPPPQQQQQAPLSNTLPPMETPSNWPFTGNILPPHLLPPPSSAPILCSAPPPPSNVEPHLPHPPPAKRSPPHGTLHTAAVRKREVTRRGLSGRLMHPLRKVTPPNEIAPAGAQTQRTRSKTKPTPSTGSQTQRATTSPKRKQKQQARSESQPSESQSTSILDDTHDGTTNDGDDVDENAPSQATSIPTIGSALGDDDSEDARVDGNAKSSKTSSLAPSRSVSTKSIGRTDSGASLSSNPTQLSSSNSHSSTIASRRSSKSRIEPPPVDSAAPPSRASSSRRASTSSLESTPHTDAAPTQSTDNSRAHSRRSTLNESNTKLTTMEAETETSQEMDEHQQRQPTEPMLEGEVEEEDLSHEELEISKESQKPEEEVPEVDEAVPAHSASSMTQPGDADAAAAAGATDDDPSVAISSSSDGPSHPFVPSSKYSDSHPLSIAHSSSTLSIGAADAGSSRNSQPHSDAPSSTQSSTTDLLHRAVVRPLPLSPSPSVSVIEAQQSSPVVDPKEVSISRASQLGHLDDETDVDRPTPSSDIISKPAPTLDATESTPAADTNAPLPSSDSAGVTELPSHPSTQPTQSQPKTDELDLDLPDELEEI